MRKGTVGKASVHIEATPETVYELVSDVRRMGEWSPECVGAEWVDGATGPAVGARFKGRNRHGVLRWSTKPRVVAADPGREFSFIAPDLMGNDNVRWTYRMEPSGTGAEVTETFEMLRDMPAYVAFAERWLMGVKDRRADLEEGMQKTLNSLKAVAEKAAL